MLASWKRDELDQGVTVIEKGVRAGQRVVGEGQYKLKPGEGSERRRPHEPIDAFIRRPVATSLLMLALVMAGWRLSVPAGGAPAAVDFPTIQVSASLPGASPETMASTVASRSSGSSPRSPASPR